MKQVMSFVILIMWLTGVVVAQGFWWTLAALFPLVGIATTIWWVITKYLGGV